jgi:hypothetical protein
MAINMQCVACQTRQSVEENRLGQRVACRACGHAMLVTQPQPNPAAMPKTAPAQQTPTLPAEVFPLDSLATEIEQGTRQRNAEHHAWQAQRLRDEHGIGAVIPRAHARILDWVVISVALAFPLVIFICHIIAGMAESGWRFLGIAISWLIACGILAGIVAPIICQGIRLADRRVKAPARSAYLRILAVLGLLLAGYMLGHGPHNTEPTLVWFLIAAFLGVPAAFICLFRSDVEHVSLRAGFAAAFGFVGLLPAMVAMWIFASILGPALPDFRPPQNLVMSLFHPVQPDALEPAAVHTPASDDTAPRYEPPKRPPVSDNGGKAITEPAGPASGHTHENIFSFKEEDTTSAPPPAAVKVVGNGKPPYFTPGGTLSDEQVVAAMTDAATCLLAELKDKEARYAAGEGTNDLCGEIALGTYALLVAGHATEDRRLHFSSEDMRPHIKTIVSMRTDAVYDLAMQANALAQLPPRPEFHEPLVRISSQLIAEMTPHAGYTYRIRPHRKLNDMSADALRWDNSNSQYGLLGVWAATEANIDVPPEYWRFAENHWRLTQNISGGWPYSGTYHRNVWLPPLPTPKAAPPPPPPDPDGSPAMTAAGIASLIVITDKIGGPVRLTPFPDRALDAGLKHLEKQYLENPGIVTESLYFAYGLERVGLASGIKYFDKTNWYRDGTERILAAQQVDGGWGYNVSHYSSRVTGTAFGLLFLARGRSPVVFNKLQYDGPWNARPRDNANLAHWLSRRTEKNINWQIVSFDAEPEDWLDAPVLLITGHGDPNFTPEQLSKLKRFVRAGGTILSTADGADAAFTAAIATKYAPAMADGQETMRQLPPNHPIYTIEEKLDSTQSQLMGLSNGIRELWVHSPIDLGATWQRRALSRDDDWKLSENLFFYATGKAPLRTKLQPLTVPDPTQEPTRTVPIVRLKYPGNWDPEPGAWERMTRLARAQYAANLQIQTLDITELTAAKSPVLHMTGTAAFTLSTGTVDRLKAFMITRDGILIADAAAGHPEFADSFRKLITSIYPFAAATPIEEGHPVLTGLHGHGQKIDHVQYRKSVRPGDAPALLEYKVLGRTVAILSEGDITSGLLGTNTWGIRGYAPATAQDLAWNLILYANSQTPSHE